MYHFWPQGGNALSFFCGRRRGIWEVVVSPASMALVSLFLASQETWKLLAGGVVDHCSQAVSLGRSETPGGLLLDVQHWGNKHTTDTGRLFEGRLFGGGQSMRNQEVFATARQDVLGLINRCTGVQVP